MQIGAVFLWSIAYNIIRVTSQVSEGDGDAQTNQTTVLISGSDAELVSGEECPTPHTNECVLPLISTDVPPIKYKVLAVLIDFPFICHTGLYAPLFR